MISDSTMKQSNTTRRDWSSAKKIYGEEHAVATSCYNLGLVYRDLRQYNEAKEYLEKGLVSAKRFTANNMLLWQQFITTWDVLS